MSLEYRTLKKDAKWETREGDYVIICSDLPIAVIWRKYSEEQIREIMKILE